MEDAQHQQGAHGIVDDLAIGTVQLSNSGKGKGKGHVLEEVCMGTVVELEIGLLVGAVAEVFLVLEAVCSESVWSLLWGFGRREPRGTHDRQHGCSGGGDRRQMVESRYQ